MEGKEIRLELCGEDGEEAARRGIMDYIRKEYRECVGLSREELSARLVSACNWEERHGYSSGAQIGVQVLPGDICFLDYGRGYLREAGYQHFGLVMSVCAGKAFVVPMTSNPRTYAKAYDPRRNPQGQRCLYALGEVEGLNRLSVLFLNDAKFINTARVIEVKAHLKTSGWKYREIACRLKECLDL